MSDTTLIRQTKQGSSFQPCPKIVSRKTCRPRCSHHREMHAAISEGVMYQNETTKPTSISLSISILLLLSYLKFEACNEISNHGP